MNINLPVYFSNREIFNLDNLFILACFVIPMVLLGYWVVVSNEEEEDSDFDDQEFPRSNLGIGKKKKKSENDIGGSDIERSAYGEALKILDRARADSLKILGRAQIRAQGLLDNTYVISKENRKKLEDSVKGIYEKQEQVLGNLSEELLENYREAVEQGKKENIRTLYEVTEVMRKEALQGVDELKDVVKKETMGVQDALEDKITEEYAKVDVEIKDYKKKKVESLNKKIFELLSNIHSEVLGQDLDQIKHEKLILDLLDREIKKSGLKSGQQG